MILKKSVLCFSIFVLSSLHHKCVRASDPVISNAIMTEVDAYISHLYKKVDFGKSEKPSAELFSMAMRGYLNLKNAGKLNEDKQVLTIADFTKSSNENRLWIIDLRHNKLVMHTYVAHGQGSGEEFATDFSNTENSHQSSIGFYVTGETYNGEHGTSLRLNGMDNGYNSAALDRGIVVHGADYVCKDFIAGNQRLGRSWGCPAVNQKLAPGIINMIKDGTCLFIYYPQKSYLKTAYWLNKKIDRVPEPFSEIEMLQPVPSSQLADASEDKPKPPVKVIYLQPSAQVYTN